MKFHYVYVLIFTALLAASQQVEVAESMKKTTDSRKIVKTGKERLGEKASDNQRVNNCKVPIKKRGSKPRPYQCHRPKP